MSIETKTLLFNAVPLFAIAVAYGAVSIAIVPTLWRNRSRATAGDLTVATIFPAIAIVAAIYGIVVADERRRRSRTSCGCRSRRCSSGSSRRSCSSFARRARGLVSGGARVLEAEARTTELDRELTAVTELATALVRTQTVEGRRADDHRRGGEGARRRVRLVRARRGRPERGHRRHRASRRRRRPLGRRDGSTCATSLPAPRAPCSTVRRSPSTTRRRRRSSTASSSSARRRGASRTRRSSPRVECSRSSRSRASRNSARSARTICACSSRSRTRRRSRSTGSARRPRSRRRSSGSGSSRGSRRGSARSSTSTRC